MRKTPKQARSIATTAALLEATAQVLKTVGFDRLTTTRVAERAGVSIGTLYQYFPSKQALIKALADEVLQRLLGELAEAVSGPRTFEGQVRSLISALIAAKARDPDLVIVLANAYFEVAGPRAIEDTLGNARRLVSHLLAAHYPAAAPTRIEHAAFVVVHAIDGVVTGLLNGPAERLRDPRMVDSMSAMVLGYLAAEPLAA